MFVATCVLLLLLLSPANIYPTTTATLLLLILLIIKRKEKVGTCLCLHLPLDTEDSCWKYENESRREDVGGWVQRKGAVGKDIIQSRLSCLPLGLPLFRAERCGNNGRDQTDFTTEVHRVFLAYSTKVMGFIDSRGVVVVH